MKENERLDEFLTYTRLLSKIVTKYKNEMMKQYDLKSVHVECLFYLSYKGDMTMNQLVKYTLEDKAYVSKAIKQLKEKDYIIYKTGYHEMISLLEKGKMLALEIQKTSSNLLYSARVNISDDEASTFINVLKKINQNLEDSDDGC